MLFVDFADVVEPYATPKSAEFKKMVAAQISYLKFKPQQYGNVFDFSELRTGLDWAMSVTDLVKNFRKGNGDLDRAIAFYFLFHNREPFFSAAQKLDFFLFTDGVTFQVKCQDRDIGILPSFKIEPATEKKKPVEQQNQFQVADLNLKIHALMSGNSKIAKFFLRLDHQSAPDTFIFDEKKFPRSEDEESLDELLLQLSIVGGIRRRCEVALEDILWMKAHVTRTLDNPEVQKYLVWLHTPDQLPGNASFWDAIYLYEQFEPILPPILQTYKDNAIK